ncbi:hypothetical protein GYH30_028766 [Glycine max]|nr:hypothetical protein GYH30_028766 [Glycine max]
MSKNTHCHSVSTQTMPETTAKIPKLVSPTGDEYPSCHSLPVLPYDLIWEILLRVPVRSLILFKCVCKSWKTLISDPQFAKDHLCISTADPNMTHQRIVARHHRDILSFSVQSLLQNPSNPAKPHSWRMSHKYCIVGSCNGLLCLSRFKHGYCRLRLWNPCTGLKSKRLSIGFYPVDITFHGLGYDHVNHRYKLLAGVVDYFETQTKIYSFGSDSSTLIQNQNLPREPIRMQGKFVSGTLNWIIEKGTSDDHQWVILSLDMVTETFGEVFLPKCVEDSEKICHPILGVSRDCLFVCFLDSKKAHWSVLMMKEYGVRDSWTKLLMTPHISIFRTQYLYPLFETLRISENGVVLLRTRTNLLLYNSNDGWLVYPRIRRKLGFDMHIYHESLVSPKS